MQRFAAKLLFQYRVGEDSLYRICEERIIVFNARGARAALRHAKRIGKGSESSFVNDGGDTVRIELVGIRDFMHLGLECEEGVVWYEIRTMFRPMERKAALVSEDKDLIQAVRRHLP